MKRFVVLVAAIACVLSLAGCTTRANVNLGNKSSMTFDEVKVSCSGEGINSCNAKTDDDYAIMHIEAGESSFDVGLQYYGADLAADAVDFSFGSTTYKGGYSFDANRLSTTILLTDDILMVVEFDSLEDVSGAFTVDVKDSGVTTFELQDFVDLANTALGY